MGRINFSKKLRMDYACCMDELRPSLQCIYIKGGYAYATDSHILVKNDLTICSELTTELIEKLDGKLIHKKDFREIIKFDAIEVKENGISATKGSNTQFFPFIETEYPKVERLLFETENKPDVAISKVGLDMSLVSKLEKSMYNSSHCKLIFKGETRGIIIKDHKEGASTALLMPVVLK